MITTACLPKTVNDVITALLENTSFLDYGLLHFIAKELEDMVLYADIHVYKTDLEDYILNRLYSKHFKKVDDYMYSAILPLDAEMCILPSNKRQIGRLKTLAHRVLNENKPFHPNADIITASQLTVSSGVPHNDFSLYMKYHCPIQISDDEPGSPKGILKCIASIVMYTHNENTLLG